jgi:hypothetical protein
MGRGYASTRPALKPLNDYLELGLQDPLNFYALANYSMDHNLLGKVKSHYAGLPSSKEKEAFKQSIIEMYDGFIARARMISEINSDLLVDKMMTGAPDAADLSRSKETLKRVVELHNQNVKYLIDNRDAYIDFLFPG